MNKYIKTLPIRLNTSLSQPVYFFSNQSIDNSIYLCQQCNSVQNALFIIDVWNKLKFNIGTTSSFKDDSINSNQVDIVDINIEEVNNTFKNNNSFDLSKQEYNKSDYNYYVYVSDDDIRYNKVGKGDDNYKVIVYKKDKILHFIALLFYKNVKYDKTSFATTVTSQIEPDENERELQEREKERERKEKERERLERERVEREKLEKEEQERIERERERIERERIERERIERERIERERIEREKQEKIRKDNERLERIEKEKKEHVCNILGLRYKGYSCYQDSVLLALLAFKNEFVEKEILTKNIDTLILDKNRDYRCSDVSDKNDRARRINIQRELNLIKENIRKEKSKFVVTTCSKLRDYFEKCPAIGGQEFHRETMNDVGEFLMYLFYLFNVDKTTKRTVTNMYTNNITDDVNNLTDADKYITDSRIELVPPIISVHQGSLIDDRHTNERNIDYYLNYTSDAILEENNLYKDISTNTTYRRRIETQKIDESEYLVFYIQRLTVDENNREQLLDNKIIPNETINVGNRQLKLHAIVVHRAMHYTCYIKCNDKWFFYNDMREGDNVIYVGNYDDMINYPEERPDPCKRGILYFYTE